MLGPTVPAIEKVGGRLRRTLVLSSRNARLLHGFAAKLMAAHKSGPWARVRLSVDVDPQSML